MTYDSRPETYEHISVVRGMMLSLASQLMLRAHAHDASKLVDPELSMFDEFTPKLRETTYGSDAYKAHMVEMGEALQHHYQVNRHHPEHFVDGVRGMDLLDLIEMLCDWMAATLRVQGGSIDSSITKNRERFGFGAEIEALLRNSLPLVD